MNREGINVPQENNVIDMNSRIQVWSRTWPKTRQNLHVECASSGNEKKASRIWWSRKITDNLGITTDGSLYESYFCENMITLKHLAKLYYNSAETSSDEDDDEDYNDNDRLDLGNNSNKSPTLGMRRSDVSAKSSRRPTPDKTPIVQPNWADFPIIKSTIVSPTIIVSSGDMFK
uniref:Uncharacterized protein n=1 Tax=Romanomermis culicivorax TaxID=13658 RepID=A0A915L7B6_ROMCU